jgi:hypothetical protein
MWIQVIREGKSFDDFSNRTVTRAVTEERPGLRLGVMSAKTANPVFQRPQVSTPPRTPASPSLPGSLPKLSQAIQRLTGATDVASAGAVLAEKLPIRPVAVVRLLAEGRAPRTFIPSLGKLLSDRFRFPLQDLVAVLSEAQDPGKDGKSLRSVLARHLYREQMSLLSLGQHLTCKSVHLQALLNGTLSTGYHSLTDEVMERLRIVLAIDPEGWKAILDGETSRGFQPSAEFNLQRARVRALPVMMVEAARREQLEIIPWGKAHGIGKVRIWKILANGEVPVRGDVSKLLIAALGIGANEFAAACRLMKQNPQKYNARTCLILPVCATQEALIRFHVDHDKQFAAMAKQVGISSRDIVSLLEDGILPHPESNVPRLARLLGMSAEDISAGLVLKVAESDAEQEKADAAEEEDQVLALFRKVPRILRGQVVPFLASLVEKADD